MSGSTLTGAIDAQPRIRSAAFSAIMMIGALMWPPTRSGITEASTTRKQWKHCTGCRNPYGKMVLRT